MFEIIGLLIATGLFFAIAAAASAILAGLTWLLMRETPRTPRIIAILMALLLPIASAAYMWLCVALLPGESLFGDVDEPLPNGYAITALGKMPDFASIADPKDPRRLAPFSEYIGKIALVGPLVVGRYSHPFGAFNPHPDEPYFIFNTQIGEVTEIPTLNALESRLGHPATLTEVQFFQSPLAQTQRRLNNTIEFGPPIIALFLLIAFVLRCRT